MAATTPGHRGARPSSSEPVAPSQSGPALASGHALTVSATKVHIEGSLAGKRIGRYVIDRLLGQGGMATVWRAVHEELGGEVAIKILGQDAVPGDDEVERFFREAKVSAQLNHDHVVKVIDYARDAELGSYIVMELLHGQGLDRVLAAEGPLDEARTIDLALQMSDALAAAHALGIVHRDLKPGNIFVTRTFGSEIVKVMDFGIAKVSVSKDLALTRPGQICGTPLYMSPEQWDSRPITEASDIYSLGVVLYEMLAGQPPVDGAGMMELVRNVWLHEPKPLSAHRSTISLDLEAVVARCLRKRPEERFTSMREVRDALERVKQRRDTGASMPAPVVLQDVPPVKPPRRFFSVAATLLAIASVVLVVGFASRRLPLRLPSKTVAVKQAPPPAAETALPAPTVSVSVPVSEPPVPPTASPAAAVPSAQPVVMVRRGRSGPRPAMPRSATSTKPSPPPQEEDLLRKE